jgi:hypothetical protein
MTDKTKQVQDYLKSTRQWNRQCRIGSAQLSLEQAKQEDKWFWLQVLIALGAPNTTVLPRSLPDLGE